MKGSYRPRIIDVEVSARHRTMGAILIEGAKWCGKSTTAEFHSKIDHRKGSGQFILTGSAKPVDRKRILHSETGRFAWLKMRPMSMYESNDSSGNVRSGRFVCQSGY